MPHVPVTLFWPVPGKLLWPPGELSLAPEAENLAQLEHQAMLHAGPAPDLTTGTRLPPGPSSAPPLGQVSVLAPLGDKCFLLDLSPDRTPASPQGVVSQQLLSHFQGHPWDTKVRVPFLRRAPYGSKGQMAPGDSVMSSQPLAQGIVPVWAALVSPSVLPAAVYCRKQDVALSK